MDNIQPKSFSIFDNNKEIKDLSEMIFVEGGKSIIGGDMKNYIPKIDVQPSSFYMGKYPVTQSFFVRVMNGYNPSFFKGEKLPVENVSWYEAVIFCNKLSEMGAKDTCYFSDETFNHIFGKKKGNYILPNVSSEVYFNNSANGYRLPTEPEWEYTARGGKYWEDDFEYSGGNNLVEIGWHWKNSHESTKVVGLKLENQLGVFDMTGNVYEWCNDWYDSKYQKKITDLNPKSPKKGTKRVIRGGSWMSNNISACRVSDRSRSGDPNFKDNYLGFRFVTNEY